MRYVRYKTQISSSHEDIVIKISSAKLVQQFLSFIWPLNGLHYLVSFPLRPARQSGREGFNKLFKLSFFPLWIDSNSNFYINPSTTEYNKSIDCKFNSWFSRLIYQISGKKGSFTALRKATVTQSREENWSQSEMVELSRTMLHSIKTADYIYTKTRSEKKSAAISKRFSERFENN